MNWVGMWTLFYKELMRFLKVTIQTLLTPVITSLLYLVVFSHVLEGHVEVYPNVSYTAFLMPGLIMMTILQNAYANSSSSLIQSKMTGNLVFLLLAPISNIEFFIAFVTAAIVRGLMVGFGLYIASLFVVDLPTYSWLWIVLFALLGSAILGAMGVIAGIWADTYEKISAFQNFIIVPSTFLSGVFYSINSLSEFWQIVSKFNPFFYLIDGFRYGFFGISDVLPFKSLLVATIFLGLLSSGCLWLLSIGYKIRQ